MHLQIRTPSPTTVEFTVSTSPLASKRRALLLFISACLRSALILLSGALVLRRMFPEVVRWRWVVVLEGLVNARWEKGVGTALGVVLAVLGVVAVAGCGGCGKGGFALRKGGGWD